MSSFIPHETLSASPPEYEGIHLDAFFFAPTIVGLPAKPATVLDDDEKLGFSLLAMTTI
jgi:hypothetical protein